MGSFYGSHDLSTQSDLANGDSFNVVLLLSEESCIELASFFFLSFILSCKIRSNNIFLKRLFKKKFKLNQAKGITNWTFQLPQRNSLRLIFLFFFFFLFFSTFFFEESFGILSTVVIFCLVVYNLFTEPWIPVWWYFLVHVEMGYLSALSVWEHDSDEPLPVWSH